jgi:hypothetical protein
MPILEQSCRNRDCGFVAACTLPFDATPGFAKSARDYKKRTSYAPRPNTPLVRSLSDRLVDGVPASLETGRHCPVIRHTLTLQAGLMAGGLLLSILLM